jgi:hypothetical protein
MTVGEKTMAFSNRDVLLSKSDAVLQGPAGELFAEILDCFFIRLWEKK